MKKIVIFVLDGAADRAIPELQGKTPLLAASTPELDSLAKSANLGLLLPRHDFKGASTDLTHFTFLGYKPDTYPGRSVFEAVAHGARVRPGAIYFSALLCGSYVRDGKTLVIREGIDFSEAETRELFASIKSFHYGFYTFKLFFQRGRYGILEVQGPFFKGITDSDPFKDGYPVAIPLPLSDNFRDLRLQEAMTAYLKWARNVLKKADLNKKRTKKGKVPLDLLVAKWPSYLKFTLPSFYELTGMKGAIVAAQSFLKGMTDLLGLTFFSLKEEDTEKKVSSALLTANHLLFEEDYDLVLINVKDADEASHLKNPMLKKEVLERIDRGFGTLTSTQLIDKSKVVFALTADHPTPSTSTLIHSGEPTPLLVHAASLIPDNTRAFNEEEAARGSLPPIQAENLLAFLLNAADRIAYSGQILSFHERLGFPNPKDIKNFGL